MLESRVFLGTRFGGNKKGVKKSAIPFLKSAVLLVLLQHPFSIPFSKNPVIANMVNQSPNIASIQKHFVFIMIYYYFTCPNIE